MNMKTEFAIHNKPIKLYLNYIDDIQISTLIGIGLVNPMGPTLTAIAVPGNQVFGEDKPIIYIMLNPFRQEISEIGRANIHESWNPLEDIKPLLQQQFGGCPTLFFPSRHFEDKIAISLYGELLTNFEEGIFTYKSICKHPGDPFLRVQEEMNEASQGVQNNLEYNVPSDYYGKLSLDEAKKFAEIQLDPTNFKSEIQAFFYAWNGSINFSPIPPSEILDSDKFSMYFARIAESCKIPVFG